MSNPILEEAAEVYIRRREYLIFHLAYAAAIALFTVLLWPTRGFMYFFRTETIPAAFQATVIAHVIIVSGVSLYAGLDRLAENQIIRYSEWLERTHLPVGILFRGKLAAGMVHTIFLVLMAAPFAVVAAGPAGVPLAAVVASEVIVLIVGLISRFAGMIISHLGETRYVLRVVGAWLFVALFFVVTVQAYQPMNPIAAVIAQHEDDSPFMQPARVARSAEAPLERSPSAAEEAGLAPPAAPRANPLIRSGLPLAAVLAVMIGLYWATLLRHQITARRDTPYG